MPGGAESPSIDRALPHGFQKHTGRRRDKERPAVVLSANQVLDCDRLALLFLEPMKPAAKRQLTPAWQSGA